MSTLICLSSESEQRLRSLAERVGRDEESCLQVIIGRGLTEMEDYYHAAEVLKRVRSGEESVHLAKDVRIDLNVDE